MSQFYSHPSYVRTGAGAFPIFSGSRRHRGGSVFGVVKRFFMPAIEKGKATIAPSAMKEGVGFAKDMVGSFFRGRNLSKAASAHGKKRAMNVARNVTNVGLNALDSSIDRLSQRLRRKKARPKPSLVRRIFHRRKQNGAVAPVRLAVPLRPVTPARRGVKRKAPPTMQRRKSNKRQRLF